MQGFLGYTSLECCKNGIFFTGNELEVLVVRGEGARDI